MSAPKRKKVSPPKAQPPSRNTVQVPCGPDEAFDDAVARELSRPAVQAAATIQALQGDAFEVNALARELSEQIGKVNGGDLRRAEGMLIAQAHTLDKLFGYLTLRAHRNMGDYLQAAETYLRLALKAQSQCRATIETLAAIKNPPIVYARQANVTTGPQQINNGTGGPSRAREIGNQQSQLSGASNELLPNPGASSLTGEANPALETVGEIDRAEVPRG